MFENIPFLAVVLIIIVYLLPSIAARGHPRFAKILIVNLFLGWTVLGWILAMFWALSRWDESDILERLEREESKYANLRRVEKIVVRKPTKKKVKHKKHPKHHKHHAKPKPQTKLTRFVTRVSEPVRRVMRRKTEVEYEGIDVYSPEHKLIATTKTEQKKADAPKKTKVKTKKQVPKSAQKFCSKCGHPLLASDKYCDHCGAKSHYQ